MQNEIATSSDALIPYDGSQMESVQEVSSDTEHLADIENLLVVNGSFQALILGVLICSIFSKFMRY